MIHRRLLLALSLVVLAFSSTFARSILQKKMYYITNTGKSGEARFWAVYLGNHDCTLTRKNPGESEKKISASVNLQLISSGYVEGNGYGSTGKVDCLPTIAIKTETGEHQIEIDSIDFIFDYGSQVQLISGEKGALIIDVEGDPKSATKFLLREYKLTNYFGEEILKKGSEETPLRAFSFSKGGATRAKKAQRSVQ